MDRNLLPASLLEAFKKDRERSLGPIGFEFTDDKIRLVQFQAGEEGLGIRALSELNVEEPDNERELRKLVRGGIRSAGFRGRKIVTALPPDRLKLMVVNYELDGHSTDEDKILELVEQRSPTGLDEAVIDYLPIRGEQEKAERSALVALASEDEVVEYLELMRRIGLEVEALEIVPVAVRRLATWPPTLHSGENTMLLYSTGSSSDLTVLWGRRLILYRSVNFGHETPIATLCRVLDVPETAARILLERSLRHLRGESSTEGAREDMEAARTAREILRPCFVELAEEITQALTYTESRLQGERINLLLLAGSIGNWVGIQNLFQEYMPLPVEVLDPLKCVPSRHGIERRFGMEVAAGLGLRGMTHAP